MSTYFINLLMCRYKDASKWIIMGMCHDIVTSSSLIVLSICVQAVLYIIPIIRGERLSLPKGDSFPLTWES